jgi:hypothetical protein
LVILLSVAIRNFFIIHHLLLFLLLGLIIPPLTFILVLIDIDPEGVPTV